MENIEFIDKFKAKIDELKEETLSHLLKQDSSYISSNEEHHLAESKYLKLNLTKEQKEVVDNLLSATDLSNMEYSTLSYLAGIYDSQKFHNFFNLEDYSKSSDDLLIKKFYYGDEIPCEHESDSAETRQQWNTFFAESDHFESSLTDSQKNEYEQLKGAQLDAVSMSIRDSFSRVCESLDLLTNSMFQ